jgi:hypothetical protein
MKIMAGNTNVPATIPALGGEQSLNRYLTEIKKFPILAPEQEYMLAKRYQEHQDPAAAAQLVTSHLRLVAKIAMGYRGYGLPVVRADLGRQYRPDAGREKVRARSRASVSPPMRCGGSAPRSRNSSCGRGAW